MVFPALRGDFSWVFDLVATDQVARHRALGRHQAALAAARDAEYADFRWHWEQTLQGPIVAFLDAADDDAVARAMWAPFAVLCLQWEADYPEEWRTPDSWLWSPWGTKEALLRRLDRGGLPGQTRPQIAELIVAALGRPYRCKDWMYACLVRHVTDASFLDRVETLLSSDDPLVRLRARFVLDVAQHPEERVKRVSWSRWLSADV